MYATRSPWFPSRDNCIRLHKLPVSACAAKILGKPRDFYPYRTFHVLTVFAGNPVAAAEHGTDYVLVTGVQLPDQFIDNVLASPQGAMCGERFERFEASFVGAGDTLSAALAAILSSGTALDIAAAEALSFLDQALDAGFRPGMGGVIPDRFFWALPPGEDNAAELKNEDSNDFSDGDNSPPLHSRNVH